MKFFYCSVHVGQRCHGVFYYSVKFFLEQIIRIDIKEKN